ncbi:MAG: hypothetical protein IJV96_03590 [Clostridia bacterium]|nr:hypothetical protein [Clostridia bacterium]
MKGAISWSYSPYRPPFTLVGEPYICRVVPAKTAIHFEWLEEKAPYEIYLRARGKENFSLVATTDACAYTITGLEEGREYEFYVRAGEKQSRVRLARCGEAEGRVVNYLHPEDDAYRFSGRFLCSPSLLRHPDGYLLASMDVYAAEHPQNLTIIFRSDDDGESWYYLCELTPCFWGQLFLHKGDVYMLACSTEYGDLLIGKSPDGGKTFDPPVTLFHGSNGKKGNAGVHKNPQNLCRFNGRLYFTMEYGTWCNDEYGHAAMVASVPEDADLLAVENWSFTAPRRFDNFAPELADLPSNTMTIEGTPVVGPDGSFFDVMRFGIQGKLHSKVLAYEIDKRDPEAPLAYSHLIDFPRANFSKFMIKYDERSGYYYTIASRYPSDNAPWLRCILSLMRSRDLRAFEVVTDLLDYTEGDVAHTGFQYVCFEIEGENIIYLCRTSMNGADDFHNSNYSTFHRIANFRDL